MLRRTVPFLASLALAAGCSACGGSGAPEEPAGLPAAAAAGAPQPPLPDEGVKGGELPAGATLTGAPASSLAGVGQTVYAAGVEWVSPLRGSSLVLAAGTGELTRALGTNGQIIDAVDDGRGGAYLAGDFDRVGGSRIRGLVHVFATGEVDRRFRPTVSGSVDALALDGSILYAGGFPQGRGDGAPGVVALNAGTGRPIDGFRTDVAAGVSELAVGGKRLYAGGSEPGLREDPGVADRPGGSAAAFVALDARTGAREEGFRPPVDRGDRLSTVTALHVFDGDLWVAQERRGALPNRTPVRILEAESGALKATAEVTGTVRELIRDGDRVIALGAMPDGERRDLAQALALKDGTRRSGFHVAAGRNAPSVASDGLLRNGTLWIGGLADEDVTSRRRTVLPASRLRGQTGFVSAHAPATGAPRQRATPVPDGPVNALARFGRGLLAGGRFAAVDVRRQSLAAFDLTTGRYAVGAPLPETTAPTSVAAAGGRLWVLDEGELLVVDPATGGILKRIRVSSAEASGELELQVAGGRVFLGPTGRGEGLARGDRTADGPRTLRGYDARTGERVRLVLPLASADPRPPRLLGDGDTLWVAGSFARARGEGRPARLSVLKLDARTGRLDAGFDVHVDGPVRGLLRMDDRLVLSGRFGRAGGLARRNLAAVSATTGAADAGFVPGPAVADRGVSLVRLGSRILVTGRSGRSRAYAEDGGPASPRTKGAGVVVAAADAAGGQQVVAGSLRDSSTHGPPFPHGVVLPPRG